MPLKMQNEAMVKNVIRKEARSTSGPKAPGTRIGLLFDWRGESTGSAKLADRYGRALRDGK